jgi:imidazolonepropionase-like amidohydrolase
MPSWLAVPVERRPLLLDHVHVLDVERGRVLRDQAVLVERGRITRIARSGAFTPLPKAQVVDAKGRFLIPGLWDMHAHLTDDGMRGLFLAHGVTGVRHMYSASPYYSPRRWRGRLLEKQFPGPRLHMADQAIDGERGSLSSLAGWRLFRPETRCEVREHVQALKKRGEDFIKVYAGLPRDLFLEVVAEARRVGLRVVGHVPHEVSAGEAARAGMTCIEHLSGLGLACSREEDKHRKRLLAGLNAGGDALASAGGWRYQLAAYESYDSRKAEKLFGTFRRQGIWHAPTLVQARAWVMLGDNRFCADQRLARLPWAVKFLWGRKKEANGSVQLTTLNLTLKPADFKGLARLYEHEKRMVKALHDSGSPLLAGTDTPAPYCFPGSGVHDELELFVQEKLMSPLAALRTATLGPARFLGVERELGTVAPGKLADLVLLDGSPLEKIENIRKVAGVVVAGRYLDGPTLERLRGDPTKGGR